jgi:arylsulfatase
MLCNRGIYHKGWTAVTKHRVPWILLGASTAIDDDVWELYDTTKDWSQAHDLAAEMPHKLAELQRLFLIEAAKYNVLPLDPRAAERANADIAGRPAAVIGNTQLLFGGMRRLEENVFINVKDKSHAVTAEITVPEAGVRGVIIAQGGNFGGWSLYAHDGRLKYCYNVVGAKHFYIASDAPLPVGTHQARMEFAYDGGGYGKGGRVDLYVDGIKVGEGRVERTHAFLFSMDETADVGVDLGSPVSEDYAAADNAFTGKVNWVQVDTDTAAQDPDHTINAEERFHLAMARQ